MALQGKSGSALLETGMFAVMVGVVAAVMLMVVFAMGLVMAAFAAGVVAVVVFAAMTLMLRGTSEPPRGPGNIKPNKTAIGAAPAPAPAAAAKSKPAAPQAGAASIAADGSADADIGTKPEMLTAPRGGTADDLKQIKGVGPKLEELMNSMGIYHYSQIAEWSEQEIAWVDENLIGFKGRVTRDEWVAQATDLAKGAS